MRKPFLILVMLLISAGVLNLKAQDTSYTFGDVKVGTTDSIWIKINAQTSGYFELISFFSEFSTESGFHTSTDDSIKLYFSPTQNINYNGEIIVRHTGFAGTDVIGIIDVRGNGRLNDPYYSTTFDLRDEALKNELHNIIDGHNSLGYSAARDEMYMDIDNQKVNGQGAAVNKLEGVYTGNFAVDYNNRQDAQNNYNFNTEHTFPQGTFNKDEPMRSDIHHLFPTKVYANSERGNKPFGMVSNPSWQEGGSRSDNSRFEPRDVQKGPTARAMLYFLIRYQNYQNYVSNQDQKVLMDWAETYAPTEIERRRNDDIYQVQNNRNPFVDYPRFLGRIHNFINTSKSPEIWNYELSNASVEAADPPYSNKSNYRFAVINTGNVDINIVDVTEAVPDLDVDSFSSKINPGEARSVYLSITNYGNNSDGYVYLEFANGTRDSVDFITFIYDGTQEKEAAPLRIFPNPVQQEIHFSTDNISSGFYEIYNLKGLMIKREIIQADQSTLNVSALPPGFYLLKIQTKDQLYAGKFIISD